jgi:hypothetical protein
MASGLASKGYAFLSIRRLTIAGVEANTDDLVYSRQLRMNRSSTKTLLTLQGRFGGSWQIEELAI